METPFIEFRNVSKRFGERTVLENVNLQIYEGQVTTIVGLSGSGKSVLLKHIVGLMVPDDGTILFHGRPVSTMTSEETEMVMARISYMFQDNALFDSMTVRENIALPLRETTNLDKAEIDRRVMARIEQMDLVEAARRYPSELSGGMQKRVALARALVTDPQIVLFDEPTTGQDPLRRNAILGMIAQYQRKMGFTAILVSHEVPDVFFISNRILVLYERRIAFQGSYKELEDFVHPLKDEVIGSMEGLQEDMADLYSRRQFKVLRHAHSQGRTGLEPYSVVVFALKGIDSIVESFGDVAAHEAVRGMARFAMKRFGAIGGVSARCNVDELVSVLPFADREEAESLLEGFVLDIQARGIPEISTGACGPRAGGGSVEVAILAGIAQGLADEEIESVIDAARNRQMEIARLRCHGGGNR
jgi:phospholipid/cholesterol/gamma-HCH transport system ATP-binding protein